MDLQSFNSRIERLEKCCTNYPQMTLKMTQMVKGRNHLKVNSISYTFYSSNGKFSCTVKVLSYQWKNSFEATQIISYLLKLLRYLAASFTVIATILLFPFRFLELLLETVFKYIIARTALLTIPLFHSK